MLHLRHGRKDDLPAVLDLIKELAAYEKALYKVENTVKMMEKDGFGKNRVFDFIVADNDSKILGAAIYYFRYSTWKGRSLYLEDLVVTETARGQGIGKLLFEAIMRITIEGNCSGLTWQVLDWNDQAINFYNKYDANYDAEWLNCSLTEKQIRSII